MATKNKVSAAGLSSGARFVVQVRAVDADGNTTKWSKMYNLTTVGYTDGGVSYSVDVPTEVSPVHVLFGPVNITYDSPQDAFTNIFEINLFDVDGLVADIGYQPNGIDNVEVNANLSGVLTAHGSHVFTVAGIGDHPIDTWGRVRVVRKNGDLGDWHWPAGE